MKESGQEQRGSDCLDPRPQSPCPTRPLSRKLRPGAGVGGPPSWHGQCTRQPAPLTRVATLPAQHLSAEGACDQPPRETQTGLQPGSEGGGPAGQLGGAGGGKAGMDPGSAGVGLCVGRGDLYH